MKTIVYQTKDLDNPDKIKSLKELLNDNKLVVFPTETVYGLGGNALNPVSAKAIYEAKGRPSDNPLIVHIARASDVFLYAKDISSDALNLMAHFWPGPITFILNKTEVIPKETTGGLDTVAIRMPNHPVALKLIEGAKLPIAAPSANISGRPSSTEFKHVYEDFDGRVDAVIDGGQSIIGLESTVIDVTAKPTILRPGAITKTMIETVLGYKVEDLSNTKPTEQVKSPGMKYTHYKPKGDVVLLQGNLIKALNYVKAQKDSNLKMAVICPNQYEHVFKDFRLRLIGNVNNSNEIARNIFTSLRDMDEWHIDKIYIYYNQTDEVSYAVMNRLLKASGYQVIDL
ncbi:MAG: L-threonylcarbamoyladenylate synthase [Acholeplasma sp.]|nr:L-threonylcarbamoyladenylate synthase [Acholeplasma sp.]